MHVFSQANINLGKVIQKDASDEGAEISLMTHEMTASKKEDGLKKLEGLCYCFLCLIVGFKKLVEVTGVEPVSTIGPEKSTTCVVLEKI